MAVNFRGHLKEHWLGYAVGSIGIALSIIYWIIEYLIYGKELFEHFFEKDILHLVPLLLTFPLFAIFGWLLDRKVMLEREARRSEEKYRELFENAYDLIFTLDLKGNFTSVNKAALQVSGYTAEEIRKLNIAQLLPPDVFQVAMMRIARAAKGETLQPYEYEFIRKNGSRAIIELSSRAILVEGKPAGIHCIARDITERVKLQRKIEESQKNLSNIIESSRDGIIAIDASGNVTLYNKGAEEIFGYSREEVLGKNIVEGSRVKFYKDLETARYVMRKIRESPNGRVAGFEVMGISKDGRELILDTSAALLRDDKGNFTGSIGIHRDLTEKKKLEEEIKKAEQIKLIKEFAERIINGIPDSISVIDPKSFKIISVNQAFLKSLGMTESQVIGMPCYEITHGRSTPCEPPNDICPLNEMLRTGKPITVEHVHFDKEGNEIYIEVSAAPIRNDGGEIFEVIHVARDISERKRLEQQIKEYAERLEQMVEERTKELQSAYADLKELSERRMDFTNMAAHELRTPLAPIIGYLAMLKDEIRDEKLLRYIEIMERNAMRQRKLIDRMLELSRLDAGKVELEYSNVDVNELLQFLLDDYAPAGRRFQVDIPKNLVIRADENKLFQILDNLISNAVKYSESDTLVEIRAEERGDDYLFKVIDHGVGIAKEDYDRIFERFYLVGGDKLARTVHRLGLGLTLTKSYVELHGGKIWVESEPGKGSTFCFTIPKQ